VQNFLALFRPIYLRVEADAAVTQHPHWSGRLDGDSAGSSTLVFRWLLLYEAMAAVEASRGSAFKFVLRLRPDALLACKLPANPLAVLGSLSAVVDKDVALLARRAAAHIAFSVYRLASEIDACALKRELCAPAVLLRHGFSVGTWLPGAIVVRPRQVCEMLQSSSFKLDSTISCGRQYLEMRLRVCQHAPGPYNLTKRMLHWRSQRNRKRAHPTRNSTDH
jgi:hypothetical protein